MDIQNAQVPADVQNDAVADLAHDDAFNSFLSELEGNDFEARAAAALAKEDAPVEDEGEAPPAEDTPPAPDKEEDRGIERIAAREKELREKLEKFESEKKAWEVEKTKLKAPTGIDPQQLVDGLTFEPDKVFTALGIDSDMLMKSLLVAKLPDDNPAKNKLRAELKDMETKRELRTLKKQLEDKDAQAQRVSQYNEMVAGVDSYVKVLTEGKAESSKNLPTLSKVATANSKYVNDRILREIMVDARERYFQGDNGDPISYEEAAKRVESELAILAKSLGSTNVPAEKKAPQPGNNSRIVPPTPTKSPRKDTPEDLEERAVRNAEAEYYRLEKSRAGGYRG